MSLTIYTKNNCGYCIQAKTLLKNNNIPFAEINIENDPTAREFVVAEGHRTMPQIYHNGKLFVEGGFTGLKNLGIETIKEKIESNVDVGQLGTL